MLKLKECKMSDGTFMQYADGGYTILYLDENNEPLCASCASKPDSTKVCFADIYWEGPAIVCADCGDGIESAYGNPEDDDEDGEKIEFRAGYEQEAIRIPIDSEPIRRDGQKAVWPFDGGDYLLTYGDVFVARYSEKTDALASLIDLDHLCPICSYPHYKSLGNVCEHAKEQKE